ncbi:MAG: hypothetical protein ACXQT3_00560 [Methermicoccaceae archaeon]
MNDHDLLVRIDERVEVIHNDIEEIKGTIASHNRRLGVLERWRAYVLGAAAVVATLISIMVGLLRW